MTEKEIFAWLKEHPGDIYVPNAGGKIYLITKSGMMITIRSTNDIDEDKLEQFILKLLGE